MSPIESLKIHTSDDDKIEVVFDLEGLEVWLRDHTIRVPPILRQLGLDIPKSPRDRQPSWEDSVRAENELVVLFDAISRVLKG